MLEQDVYSYSYLDSSTIARGQLLSVQKESQSKPVPALLATEIPRNPPSHPPPRLEKAVTTLDEVRALNLFAMLSGLSRLFCITVLVSGLLFTHGLDLMACRPCRATWLSLGWL